MNYFINRTNCPVCNSPNNKEIYNKPFCNSPISEYLNKYYSLTNVDIQKYFGSSNYVLVSCNICGLIYQTNIPNESLQNKIYNEWINCDISYKKSSDKQKNISFSISSTLEIINIVSHFNYKNSLKVLDFGIGWAFWATRAKTLGCDVYGVEISKERKENALSNEINIIDYEEIPNFKFHLININHVFEHIDSPLETLQYLSKNALLPGGIVRINVPNGFDIYRRLKIEDWFASKNSKNSLTPLAPLEHINCFNYHSLRILGLNAGLKPIRLTKYYTNNLGDYFKNLLNPFVIPLTKRKTTLQYFIK